MDNCQYFTLPEASLPPTGPAPPVPPKAPGQGSSPRGRPALSLSLNLSPCTQSTSGEFTPDSRAGGEIAQKVQRFQTLLGGTREPSPPKNLWFYKDGLRTPTTPPPTTIKPPVTLPIPPLPAGMAPTLPPVTHVATAHLTVSPRVVRARLGDIDFNPLQHSSVTSMAMSLKSEPRLTTSFSGSPGLTPNLSLCSQLNLSSSSLSSLPTPTLPTPYKPRPTVKGKPPALPPKPSPSPVSPPPRPVSKELRLDDILSMCAEYERQIEEEQREARDSLLGCRESVALSPAVQTQVAAECGRPVKDRPGARPTVALPDTPATPGPLSPSSPSATLQAPRIKTNGSLPRDGKRLPSPSRTLPPTSPLSTNDAEISGIFTFERLCPSHGTPGSPVLAGSLSRPSEEREELRRGGLRLSSEREEGRRGAALSASPAVLLALPSSASSPRTRIRTTLNRTSTSSSETLKDPASPANSLLRSPPAPSTPFSLADYQGGKEGLMDTDRSPEQLYTEAKDVLALVPSSPSESPSSTAPRRPPRSKHDTDTVDAVVPSAEAHHRLLIGTGMIHKHTGVVPSPSQQLKSERAAVLTEVTRAAQELAEISVRIEEAERSADLESSLVGAEMAGNEVNIANLSVRLHGLSAQEEELALNLQHWRLRSGQVMAEARSRLEKAESELDELENQESTTELDTDAETELLEQLKQKHEHLEAERRIFEDLEFRTMEEEASLEAEIEDVSMVISKTQKNLESAENIVSEMELQKAEISVSQDVSILQERRETVASKLEFEKQKLGDLETRLKELMATTAGHRDSEDSGTITWSDEETVRTGGTLVQGRGDDRSGRRSSESTSDLPQDSADSRSPSPAPVPRVMTKASSRPALPTPSPSPPAVQPRPRRGARREAEGRVEGGESSEEGRPVSGTESCSLWGGEGSWAGEGRGSLAGVSMRRAASSLRGGQRPLTRYLPVTQNEGFDLRAHIETAGHQIELCKHIVVNSCSCRGYLTKQGSRLKGWNRRWFVFDRNKRTLVYYADKSEGKAKGGIYFHSISEVYVDHQKTQGAGQKATFIMKTHDRKYSLTAPSQEAMRIWVDVLFTGAEGYQEFQDME